jgi:hypothetical protein
MGTRPTPGELATPCRNCGTVMLPWHIAYVGGPFASAGYKCACGSTWLIRWADDDEPEGAAALAAVGAAR